MRKLSIELTLILTLISLFVTGKSFAQDSTYVKKGTVKVETSENIKQIIAQKRTYNKNKKYVQGYKIQLYYGSEQRAKNVREKFKTIFSDVPTELKFTTPDWKVWVGNYKKRLEADEALEEIKKEFPSAIPVAAKVRI